MYSGLLVVNLCVDFLDNQKITTHTDNYTGSCVSSPEVSGISSDICVIRLLIGGSEKSPAWVSGN